jgi:hypothetical protein
MLKEDDTMSEAIADKKGPTFSKERLESYTKGKTGALNNGDAVAQALDEFLSGHEKGDERRSACTTVAEANGLDCSGFSHLNNGGFRMAVGNGLRKLVKTGKVVKIGKAKITANDLGVEVEAPAPAKAPSAAKAAAVKAAPKAATKGK